MKRICSTDEEEAALGEFIGGKIVRTDLIRDGEKTSEELEINKDTIPNRIVSLGETLDGYDVEGREDIMAEIETMLMLLQGKLFGEESES